MVLTNFTTIGIQMANLTNNILQFITFQSIYSYVLLDILIIAFVIAMESHRVENIVLLALELDIVQWFFVFGIFGLERIGFINFPPIEITPAIILLVLILLAPKIT
jgi:hypothetical protein